MTIPRSTRSAALAASLVAGLASGCSIDYQILPVPKDDTSLDDCAQLCSDAIDAGCTRIDCGIDAFRDYTGSADAVVFHLDGASDGGGGCELVAECPGTSGCPAVYAACLAASGSLEVCAEQFDFCEREEACSPALVECNAAAETQRDWCNENTPDADCEYWYLVELDACQCNYDDCLTDDTLDCAPEAAALISPPIHSGPTAWTVSRAFVDHQLARLAALAAETRVWPVPTADGMAWRGLRVGSIGVDEPAFAVGLREGDVIRTLDGVPIIEALSQPGAVLALRGARRITLGVERGAVIRQHVYRLVP